MDRSRRETFRTLSKLAFVGSGIYLLSKLPTVNAQSSEIDVGVLHVPVTLDGQIDKGEWDNDTIPYQPPHHLFGLLNVVFRAKRDPTYTYMALYAPNFTGTGYTELYFDTKMTGSLATGTDGLYVLVLKPTTNGWYESPTDNTGYVPGTMFHKLFSKGTDYDWAGSFGPSGMQLEFKFKNDILMKNAKDNEINFNAFVMNLATSDAAGFSGEGYIQMVFKQQVLPEFDSETVVLLSSLVGVVAATGFAKKRFSRRDLFHIH